MNEDIPVITIDGPSGSGKGVISQRLSTILDFHLLDSGALYRVTGVAARRQRISLDNEHLLAELASRLEIEFTPTGNPEEPVSVLLSGQDITRDIRTDEAGVDASKVAKLPLVRQGLRQSQRSFLRAPGLVADGRDMGTVVFTEARLKIFLTASPMERAKRRYKQLKHKDIGVSLHALLDSIRERDERDMNREVAPLKPAEDAVLVDSTGLSINEVLEKVLSEVKKRGIEGSTGSR
jgi:cytidylate kinase